MPILKKIFKTILIATSILVITILLGVLYYFNIYREEPLADPADFDQSTLIFKSEKAIPDTLNRLKIDNLYWSNRLEMAGDESIDLLLDLVTQQLLIEIQGVTVYSSPVTYYTLSDSLLWILAADSLYVWLSTPFKLKTEWATVAKEPIQIREIRPRSTGENGLTRFRDPEAEKYVSILLGFSGNLSVSLRQIEAAPDTLYKPESPTVSAPYHIELLIPRVSAQAIYRAISANSTSLAFRPE